MKYVIEDPALIVRSSLHYKNKVSNVYVNESENGSTGMHQEVQNRVDKGFIQGQKQEAIARITGDSWVRVRNRGE